MGTVVDMEDYSPSMGTVIDPAGYTPCSALLSVKTITRGSLKAGRWPGAGKPRNKLGTQASWL